MISNVYVCYRYDIKYMSHLKKGVLSIHPVSVLRCPEATMLWTETPLDTEELLEVYDYLKESATLVRANLLRSNPGLGDGCEAVFLGLGM